MTVYLPAILLIVFLLSGIPVGFALGLAGAIGLVMVSGFSGLVAVLQTVPLSTVASFELITIPMFLLMAQLVMISGIADELFNAAAAWVGRIPGGLGVATAVAGAGFGAVCGTSTAAAATLSTTSLPAMLRHGYEPKMAAGVVAISGTLAMLIPPSVMLILFGLLAEVNIGHLLIGGVVPGLVVTGAISLTVVILVLLDPSRAPKSERVSWGEKIVRLRVVGPMIVLMSLVTGIIYTGAATPTEASAVGALGALGIALWRGKLDGRSFGAALFDACEGTCMIAMIIIGAIVFNYYFTITQLTQGIVGWVSSLGMQPWMVMACLLAVYLVLGCFLDQVAILVLTIPIVMPVVKSLGYDPVWFGVVVVVTAEVGLITPPVGLNCFVVARYARRPVSEIFGGILPHFWAHLIVIALFMTFPQLVTWLPSKMN